MSFSVTASLILILYLWYFPVFLNFVLSGFFFFCSHAARHPSSPGFSTYLLFTVLLQENSQARSDQNNLFFSFHFQATDSDDAVITKC